LNTKYKATAKLAFRRKVSTIQRISCPEDTARSAPHVSLPRAIPRSRAGTHLRDFKAAQRYINRRHDVTCAEVKPYAPAVFGDRRWKSDYSVGLTAWA